MDDDDATEASVRRLLDPKERPTAQAQQIHPEIDDEEDEHEQAPGFHTAPVDTGQTGSPLRLSMNRMNPRKRPCAAQKTRLVTRNP